MTKTQRAELANERLKISFPTVETPLTHKNAYELLVAVILSAQTLDTTTNKVTPALFERYPTVFDLAKANIDEVDSYIKSINYHRTKAKHLIEMANILINEFDAKVPKAMIDLIKLPGVGRKVANVVISEWFAKREGIDPEGFVVDTHVKRVAYRLGFTESENPVIIERDMMKIVQKKEWVELSLRFIFHGRTICKSQRPMCEVCPLKDICPKVGVDPKIKQLAAAQ